jgi:hypothetical protein
VFRKIGVGAVLIQDRLLSFLFMIRRLVFVVPLLLHGILGSIFSEQAVN